MVVPDYPTVMLPLLRVVAHESDTPTLEATAALACDDLLTHNGTALMR